MWPSQSKVYPVAHSSYNEIEEINIESKIQIENVINFAVLGRN